MKIFTKNKKVLYLNNPNGLKHKPKTKYIKTYTITNVLLAE